jgi:myo-inositol-1(or 4)-monophosphatase
VIAADGLLDLARTVACEAGELIVAMRNEGVDVAGTKSSAIDVVTEADQACEQLIRKRVLDARPDDGFLGEEGDDVHGSSGVRWIVDPIDGTVNYLYGIPAYAVSIGVEVDGTVVAGVVRNPAIGEEFTAVRGGGAFLGERRLAVRPVPPLEEALVSTGFSYETEIREHQARAAARMLPLVRDLRRAGSCALDLCAIAAGRSDGYVEECPHLWDFAAGGLIAQEAGARFVVRTSSHGRNLVLCAPAKGFVKFAALVAESGF